jgi:hypothetical protein
MRAEDLIQELKRRPGGGTYRAIARQPTDRLAP